MHHFKHHAASGILLTALIAAPAVQADTPEDRLSTGLVAGTLGAGLQISYEARPNLNLRAQYTRWNLTTTQKVDDIDYDVDATLGAVGLYADYYPFSNSFHLSVGLTRNLTELKVKNQRFTQSFDIGGTTITGTTQAGAVTGKASFNTAPYIGIGWGQYQPQGWGIRLDVGAHFLGKPDVNLSVDQNKLPAGAPTVSQADIQQEEQKARNDIGDVIYPELSLTVTYGW